MRTLIHNGTIILEQGTLQGDLLIEGGQIARIAPRIDDDTAQVVDASGLLVFPGFIDTHTHFDLDLPALSTADDFITGSRAALCGGTTCVLDFATQERGMTFLDALEKWHAKARGASCHYGFHMAASEWNDARRAEVAELIARGVTSFKMYMVYDNMRVSDAEIADALRFLSARGCVLGVHCEEDTVIQQRTAELLARGETDATAHPLSRPDWVEAMGITRLIAAAKEANAPAWIVHLSTEKGLALARQARAEGQQIYLETCPQYLCLTDDCYTQEDAARFIMSPPLRKAADNAALLCALRDGEIDVIGTDHCSFTMAQKATGATFAQVPNGGAGVQNRAELLYAYGVAEGYITLNQMADLLATNAAKRFGMYPKRGVLREGAAADITIFDPCWPHTISHSTNLHNCDNSPYEGIQVPGRARHVFLNGEWAVRDGEVILEGRGQYIARGAGK
ncbi:MAG: dihydropyrimidinase [Clostridiales bacterium]|nr:dihydropyrimidinase [Clostridiales bacterium]